MAAAGPWELSFPNGHTAMFETYAESVVSGKAACPRYRARRGHPRPGSRSYVVKFSRRHLSLSPSLAVAPVASFGGQASERTSEAGWLAERTDRPRGGSLVFVVRRLGADPLFFPSPFSPVRPPLGRRCRCRCRCHPHRYHRRYHRSHQSHRHHCRRHRRPRRHACVSLSLFRSWISPFSAPTSDAFFEHLFAPSARSLICLPLIPGTSQRRFFRQDPFRSRPRASSTGGRDSTVVVDATCASSLAPCQFLRFNNLFAFYTSVTLICATLVKLSILALFGPPRSSGIRRIRFQIRVDLRIFSYLEMESFSAVRICDDSIISS